MTAKMWHIVINAFLAGTNTLAAIISLLTAQGGWAFTMGITAVACLSVAVYEVQHLPHPPAPQEKETP